LGLLPNHDYRRSGSICDAHQAKPVARTQQRCSVARGGNGVTLFRLCALVSL
jgi:hypothetical protein